jgi:hypothetical protein
VEYEEHNQFATACGILAKMATCCQLITSLGMVYHLNITKVCGKRLRSVVLFLDF